MQVSFCPFNQSIKLRRKRGDIFFEFSRRHKTTTNEALRGKKRKVWKLSASSSSSTSKKEEEPACVCVVPSTEASIDPKMWKQQQPKIKGWSFLTNRHIRHHFFFQLWSIIFFLTFCTKKSRSILLHSTKCPEIVLIGTFYTSKTISLVYNVSIGTFFLRYKVSWAA